ncbi:MAG TPA: 3-oxoacyl-ACP synthase [Lachnospiraceae bacterium]|nr:3-oxoacyl-ACP synthase [Lachnospiraceae bacterium]
MKCDFMKGIQILGMGHALPVTSVTNEDMERLVDTSDEWIRSRSGIENRRICTGEEELPQLAADASAEAIRKSGISPDEIGLVIVATCTSGFQVPSVGCMIQKRLGLPSGIPAFDINCACAGFIYGMQMVHALLNQASFGGRPYALLVGAERISDFIDYKDRSTCVLFGDGAGAAVIGMSEEKRFFCHTAAEGDEEALFVENIEQTCGGKAAEEGETSQAADEALEYEFTREKCRVSRLHMDGRRVFRFATAKLAEEISVLTELSGVEADEVDHIVCHQANRRIIEYVRKKWKLPQEKFFMNLDRYGNTSAASIPLVLYDMQEKGRIKPGDKVFCIGFGAGLTWGGAYLEF